MTDVSQSLLARFDVTTTEVEIGDDRFSIVHPKNAEELIDEAAFKALVRAAVVLYTS